MPVPPNNATASSVNGTLVATSLLLAPNSQQARIVLTGTYTGVTGTIDVSMDGTTWLNKQSKLEADGSLVSGTITSSAANQSYLVDCDGFAYVRYLCTACASGTLVQTVYAANSLQSISAPIIANTSSQTTFTNGSFSGTLGVTGAATLSSTLAVTGTSTFTGSMTLADDLLFTGATGVNRIQFADNLADGLSIGEGATSYITFVSTDSSEGISVKKDLTMASGVDLIFTGTTGQCLIKMTDNLADALSINEAGTSYMTFVTTNSGEGIAIKKDTTFSGGVDLIFVGTTGQSKILMTDNLADALTIGEAANAYVTFVTTDSGEKISLVKNVVGTLGITSIGPTAGIGYATGAGGTVTQASSRTTGVTINTVTGNIVLVSAAGSPTPFSFTVTNSAVAAGDTIIVNQKSGTDKYTTQVVTAVAAGSFQLTLANASGTTTEQPVFNFNVIKGVAA